MLLIQWEILVNRWNSKLINVNLFLLLTGVVSKLLERNFFNPLKRAIRVSKSLTRGLEKCWFHFQQNSIFLLAVKVILHLCPTQSSILYIPGFNCPEREANHSIQSTSLITSIRFYISFRFSNVIFDAAVQSSPFQKTCNFTLTAVNDRLAEQWRTWQWPVLSHFQRNMNGVIITVNSHLGDPKSVSWNDLEFSVHKSQM
jgi:hypothetical protein